jgi:hypothetical protein
MKALCAVGMRVSLVPQHWLRPYETGIVVGQQRQALKKWLVQFEDSYAGGGIDGDKIWCDDSDFAQISPARNSERSTHPQARFSLGDGALFPIVGDNGESHKAPEAEQ